MSNNLIMYAPSVDCLLENAKVVCSEQNLRTVKIEHLFVSFFEVHTPCFGVTFLKECGLNIPFFTESYKSSFTKRAGKKPKTTTFKFSQEVKDVLKEARKISEDCRDEWVTMDAVFLACILNLASEQKVFDSLGICFEDLYAVIIDHISEDYPDKGVSDSKPQKQTEEGLIQKNAEGIEDSQVKSKLLESICINLNKLALKGKIDDVFNRDEEIENLEAILYRHKKKNPLIVGEPGVGKTTIVEGLVLKVVTGACSLGLVHKVFYQLNINDLVAGSTLRGQFEEKLKKVIKEAQKKDVILFIDEVHTIVGAGNEKGDLDVANVLKPYLSDGSITLIGATTEAEYKNKIEKDKALRRRFEVVRLKEPSKEESLDILRQRRESYEKKYEIKIPCDILPKLVDLAERYIENTYFPDKAFDLLDSSCGRAKMKGGKKPIEIIKMEREIARHWVEQKVHFKSNESIDRLGSLYEKWAKTISNEDIVLGFDDIAHVLSEKTGLSKSDLLEGSSLKSQEAKARLQSDVFGLKDVVEKVFDNLLRHDIGFSEPKGPIASFLFAGDKNSGKTYFAKTLAKYYFGRSNFIYFDMSEYSSEASISKLMGANPGYVGYKEGNTLIDAVIKNPNSVIFLDNLNKANPMILNLLPKILEEGAISDSSGRECSFSRSVVIASLNISLSQKESSMGFVTRNEGSEIDAKGLIREHFTESLIPYFDESIIFHPPSQQDRQKIVQREFEKISNRVAKNSGIKISFSDDVSNLISKRAQDKGLKVVINDELVGRISNFLVSHPSEKNIFVDVFDGNTVVSALNEKSRV